MIIFKSIVVWLVFILAESLNGTVRTLWLIPTLGPSLAHTVSFVIGSLLIVTLATLFVPWLKLSRWQGLGIGLLWSTLTLAFTWTQRNESQVQASFNALGEPAHLTLTLTPEGSLQQVKLSRWGNPEGGDHHYVDFGVIVEAHGTFGGYTIPTKMRAGWFFGTDRFEPEGEFFRCTIDRAIYR